MDRTPTEQATVLRNRFSRFLNTPSARRLAITDTLRRFRDKKWRAFVFGGTLRDLMTSQSLPLPRDIDIVVQGVDVNEMECYFADCLQRKTRFGGLNLLVDGWRFDVWPVDQTWAIREHCVRLGGLRGLVMSTFLNVEAVLVELNGKNGAPRRVYTNGFFEAIRSRTLEINLEENPFPSLCVVRALVTAANLNYRIGPRLARYLDHYGHAVPLEELVEVQRSHYGMIRQNAVVLRNWLSSVREQRRCNARRTIELPGLDSRQLELWSSQGRSSG